MYAVSQALTVLSWYENLPVHEQPPRHIWWSEELVDEWLRNVKEKRNKESGGGHRRTSYEESEDVPMSENELIDRSGPIPKIKTTHA